MAKTPPFNKKIVWPMNDQTTRTVMRLLQNTEPGVPLVIVPGV